MSGTQKIDQCGLNSEQRKKVIAALMKFVGDEDNKVRLRAVEKILELEKETPCLSDQQRHKVTDALVVCVDDDNSKTALRAVEKLILMEKANQRLEDEAAKANQV